MTRQEEILALLDTDANQALTLMIETYSPLLWAAASERLCDPEDIRECVNDAFADFWQARETFDPEKGSLAAYLATIARRRAVSAYRKNRRRFAEVPSDDAEKAAEEAKDAFLALENRLMLDEAIASLKPEDAEMIRMKYYNGMTVQEIADSLQLPYETVKKRCQRSIGKMRRFLLISLIIALLSLLSA